MKLVVNGWRFTMFLQHHRVSVLWRPVGLEGECGGRNKSALSGSLAFCKHQPDLISRACALPFLRCNWETLAYKRRFWPLWVLKSETNQACMRWLGYYGKHQMRPDNFSQLSMTHDLFTMNTEEALQRLMTAADVHTLWIIFYRTAFRKLLYLCPGGYN